VLDESWDQARSAVRFDWGATGAARVGGRGGVLVVVDVLSFTTAVDVALERGSAVYPAAMGDADAAGLARDVGGVLAVDRRDVSERHPWSLSPAALRAAPVAGRLVLPSPNGAAIAAAAAQPVVLAASLRNAGAVAAWLVERGRGETEPITVIAAGERWPDGSLRPALEDLLGAGAVLAALAAQRAWAESPEAASARAVYESTRFVADAIRRCASGVELARSGFAEDIDIAVDADASDVVPVRRDGSFQPA
jgi:2-phosphosulfolactate phosphatase